MKYSLLAALLLNSGLAYSASEDVPTCASLNQKTLYGFRDTERGWGEVRCPGGDVSHMYVEQDVVVQIKWDNGSKRCVVLRGEYVWKCKTPH